MAELADAPDLGSGVPDVQVRFLSPAPKRNDNLLTKIVVSFCTLHSSLFSLRSSLFSQIVVSGEKIKEKREKRFVRQQQKKLEKTTVLCYIESINGGFQND